MSTVPFFPLTEDSEAAFPLRSAAVKSGTASPIATPFTGLAFTPKDATPAIEATANNNANEYARRLFIISAFSFFRGYRLETTRLNRGRGKSKEPENRGNGESEKRAKTAIIHANLSLGTYGLPLRSVNQPFVGFINHFDKLAEDSLVFTVQTSGGFSIEIAASKGELDPDLGFARLAFSVA